MKLLRAELGNKLQGQWGEPFAGAIYCFECPLGKGGPTARPTAVTHVVVSPAWSLLPRLI